MKRIPLLTGLVALLLASLGCGGFDQDRPTPNGAPGAATGGSTGMSASGAAAGGSAGMASAGGSSGPGGSAGALDAPDAEQALLAFLDQKQYADWAKESGYHESAGPHGGGVRVYYSPKAAAALTGGADAFPTGAAAVKELSSGGSLYGHAVWIKVQDDSDQGNGFFWYEIIRHDGGNVTVYGNARGSGDCVGCHQAGKDYDLSTLPFE